MTIEDLINLLMLAPDLKAPAMILLDGRAHEVRAATLTDFEPHAGAPVGVALVRLEVAR